MGLRKRLAIRGADYVKTAIEQAHAESGETEMTQDKIDAAAKLTGMLVSELGILGAAKTYPKVVSRLRAIQIKEGNRFMSEDEFNGIVGNVVSEIREKKQAKILKREMRKEGNV